MQAVLPQIVILLIGLWLSGKADQFGVGLLSRTPHFDPTLKSFFASLVLLDPDRHPARGAVGNSASRRAGSPSSAPPAWRRASCC
jgi:hypothetical protein